MEELVNSIVNRHMARALTQLTEAGCPDLFGEAVKGKFQWLRSDLIAAVKKDCANGKENTALYPR